MWSITSRRIISRAPLGRLRLVRSISTRTMVSFSVYAREVAMWEGSGHGMTR